MGKITPGIIVRTAYIRKEITEKRIISLRQKM